MATRVATSAVFPLPIEQTWKTFRDFTFPGKHISSVESCEIEAGAEAAALGAIRKITWNNGQWVRQRLLALDDLNFTLSWELIESNPDSETTGQLSTLKLFRVSETNQTVVQWSSEFSAAVSASLITFEQKSYLQNLVEIRASITAFKDSQPGTKSKLTEEEATTRASLISEIFYDFKVHMVPGSATYDATNVITFHHKDPKAGTHLDFNGHIIRKLIVNGKEVKQNGSGVTWKANRLNLDGAILLKENHIHIDYTNKYDHHGEGFHQFIDPEDKTEYIYSNFEPFEAHRLLPCFDQPNLKAKFTVTVTAPDAWEVICNNPCVFSTVVGTERTSKYSQTPAISTYIFAVIAGPYAKFEEVFEDATTHQKIKLGAFCRKSLTKFFDHDNIFTITKQGLKFFNDFFQFPYPFEKYDQIFVPEFNWGAMENAGAVTFWEGYVFRDPPTDSQHVRRADTILHEMAHMWFGNLVSPVWWDGLWLNESFATYMAALAVAESTRFKSMSWQEFSSSMKEWAYREDQLSTTHSIQGKVADTTQCFLNFDGITYGKGASVLKQLVFVLEVENFKRGMQIYFQKYKWSNTTISDFLGALQEGADKGHKKIDLKAWAEIWLQKPGLNSIEVATEEKDGKLEGITLIQTAPKDHPTLRTHKVEIAVFDEKDGKPVLRVASAIDVPADAKYHVAKDSPLLGPAPVCIFANNGDHAFIKTFMDAKSLKYAAAHLDKFEDPLLRQLLWQTFYSMTRDAKMRPQDYLQLVRDKLSSETNLKLVGTILGKAEGCISNFVPDAAIEKEADLMFDAIHKLLVAAKSKEARIHFARSLVSSAQSKEKIAILQAIFKGETKIDDFELDQSMRWSVITKSVAYGLPNAKELLEFEEKKDASDTGKKRARTARASFPDIAVKEAIWSKVLDPKAKDSLHDLACDMGGFRWRVQVPLLKKFDDQFFTVVHDVCKTREKEFANEFVHSFYPDDPESDEILKKTKDLLASCTEEEKLLKRRTEESLDDALRSRRCIACYLGKEYHET